MPNPIIQRALEIATHEATRGSFSSFEKAIARLRTMDRNNEVPASQYRGLQGIAHARAGHRDEARRLLQTLVREHPAFAQELRRHLLASNEGALPSFRAFVDATIPALAETLPGGGESTHRQRVRLWAGILVAAVLFVSTGVIIVMALESSNAPSSPAPVAVSSETQAVQAPLDSNIVEQAAGERESKVEQQTDQRGRYEAMTAAVCKIVIRVQVLLPDGREVRVPWGSGTGFVISRDGLVLTNKHVVEAGQQAMDAYSWVLGWDMALVFGGQRAYVVEGGVAQMSASVDLAWIRVPQHFENALPFGSSPVPGTQVWAYGFPGVAQEVADALSEGELRRRASECQQKLDRGEDLSLFDWLGPNGTTLIVTSGIISAIHATEHGMMLQTDTFIHGGNSGGPVIDESGRVIGVATARSTQVESANILIAGRTVYEELAREHGIAWPERW